MKRKSNVECFYRSSKNKITASCPELGIEIGPFLGRGDAEEAMYKAISKKQRITEDTCLTHHATEYAP